MLPSMLCVLFNALSGVPSTLSSLVCVVSAVLCALSCLLCCAECAVPSALRCACCDVSAVLALPYRYVLLCWPCCADRDVLTVMCQSYRIVPVA